jgi:hypothetical protein
MKISTRTWQLTFYPSRAYQLKLSTNMACFKICRKFKSSGENFFSRFSYASITNKYIRQRKADSGTEWRHNGLIFVSVLLVRFWWEDVYFSQKLDICGEDDIFKNNSLFANIPNWTLPVCCRAGIPCWRYLWPVPNFIIF